MMHVDPIPSSSSIPHSSLPSSLSPCPQHSPLAGRMIGRDLGTWPLVPHQLVSACHVWTQKTRCTGACNPPHTSGRFKDGHSPRIISILNKLSEKYSLRTLCDPTMHAQLNDVALLRILPPPCIQGRGGGVTLG